MQRTIIEDLKLLAVGAGIGGLICASLVGDKASSTCGTVALIAVMIGLAFRYFENR